MRSPSLPPGLVERLRAAGCVFAEDEAALLVEAADDEADLDRMAAMRVRGVPVEVVVGWAEFCGLRIAVEATVFVPRRRTELLVHLALEHLRPGDVVVDLGCGTGAIAAALLAGEPALEVWAVDIDSAAVACARRNLPPHRVLEGDLYAALPWELRGRVTLLAANAPYVPTDAIATMPPEARDHEARVALDGGPDGLDVQRRVVARAREWLAPGGRLLVETGAPQAEQTTAEMAAVGLSTEVRHDDAIEAVVAVGRVPRVTPAVV